MKRFYTITTFVVGGWLLTAFACFAIALYLWSRS